MSELSRSGRDLFERARGARPSPSARARIRAGLEARLAAVAAASAVTAVAPTKAAAAVGTSSGGGVTGALAAKLVIGALAGALAVGAIAFVFTRGAPSRRIAASVARPVSVAIREAPQALMSADVAPAPSLDAGVGRVVQAPIAVSGLPVSRAQAVSRAATAGSVVQTSIAAEVAGMRDAEGALKAGDPVRSLRALDDLATRFPNGALREERLAARVLALCGAGRVVEAREAGRRFLAELPHSVQAERVRASCAFASPAEE